MSLPDLAAESAPPEPERLAALAAAIQPGARLDDVRPLAGGISSSVHALDLVEPDGRRRPLVLRRYGRWRLTHDPTAPRIEWTTLDLLARRGLPVPEPIHLDVEGALLGTPSLVMSRLPGRGSLRPADPLVWVEQMALALAALHRGAADADLSYLRDNEVLLAESISRAPTDADVLGHPDGAAVADALVRWWPRIGRLPTTLIHGDYWPGNVVWDDGRLSGIVDWEQPRRGQPGQDVGCCRVDITLLAGADLADHFQRTYEAAAGWQVPDVVFWDLHAASWALPDPAHWLPGYHGLGATVEPDEFRQRYRILVRRALERAG